MAIERAIDAIAWSLDLDPIDVRLRNLYGPGRDMTPYGMQVTDNISPEIMAALAKSSDYRARRAEIASFNESSPILKRGIALTPVKFGISFTTLHLNQAGALVHVYQDGSVHLNQGRTGPAAPRWGRVCSSRVRAGRRRRINGIDLDYMKITPTTTAKVPNTSATAASSGSISTARRRAPPPGRSRKKTVRLHLRARLLVCRSSRSRSGDNQVVLGTGDAVPGLHQEGIFRTRVAIFDRVLQDAGYPLGSGQARPGRPFYYFSYGAACSEVLIDTFTGEMKVTTRGHPPRRWALAQSGDRHRPDRGWFRAGHGLADCRGTRVRPQGPASDPRAVDLQDSNCLRRASGFPCTRCFERQPCKYNLSFQGGRGTAADVGDFCLCGDCRRDP